MIPMVWYEHLSKAGGTTFCKLAKSHIDPKQKNFDNKCQRLRHQNMAHLRVNSHGSCGGNFKSIKFSKEIFQS